MGDRANVFVVDSPDAEHGIYLYTHWDGYSWPERLRLALSAARSRWGDPQYATRIVVREMFAEYTGETGGGISTWVGDNGYPILICDQVNLQVAFAEEGMETDRIAWRGNMSFAEYVAQSEATWPNMWES